MSVDTAAAFFECDMTIGESHQFAGGEAVVFSAPSPVKTTPNEDAVALLPTSDASGILAVADGVRRNRCGAETVRLAIHALEAALRSFSNRGGHLSSSSVKGLDNATEAVSRFGGGAAPTMAAVEISAGVARPYHVDDSMALIVGDRDKIKLQTVSHSSVGYAVEAGVLEENEALHHKDRHLVSNLVGTEAMRIEIGSAIRLAPRDTVIVASDGLFDNLRIDEIVENFRKGPLQWAVRKVIDHCRTRMQSPVEGLPAKPDDFTFIVFRQS